MTSRGACARLAAVVAAVAWLSATRVAVDAAPPPPGSLAPNFALTTQLEDRLWLAQLRGRVVVLAFGCTRCGACPDLVDGLTEVARRLGEASGRRVVFALVTMDPAHDTPAALRAFGRARGLGPPAWVFFTEERSGEVDVVARRYGVEVRRVGDRIETRCAVTLIDAAGAIRGHYEPRDVDALRRSLGMLLTAPSSP